MFVSPVQFSKHESPIALKIPDPILYINVKTRPTNSVLTYKIELAIKLSGVLSKTKNGFTPKKPITPRANPPTTAKVYAVCNESSTLSYSFAPKYCAIITVAPVANPMKKVKTKFNIWPDDPPTLARASDPADLPTIDASFTHNIKSAPELHTPSNELSTAPESHYTTHSTLDPLQVLYLFRYYPEIINYNQN